ncbi:MAG TPA: hypothetical protein VGP93_20335 [Polyangiaceae bacterium]|nr:hypothetical protein [Polyangiaceae bacterium]
MLALFSICSAGCSAESANTDEGPASGGSSSNHVGGNGGQLSSTGGTNSTTGGTATGGVTSGGTAGNATGAATGGTGATGGAAVSPCHTAPGEAAPDQDPGVWVDVSPCGVDFASTQVGAGTILVDPVRQSDLYVNIQFNGTWKSTDYGVTWTKVSTSEHSMELDSGFAWYAAIDPNPARDPNTPPTLYVTQGYGAGGVWKSTDGGVNFANVWDHNVYKDDGTTDIFSDVGGDIHCLYVVGSNNPDHLILSLHSYWGDSGNNGVFESTDGGGKWIVHTSETFNFQPHSDVLFPIDDSTWVVSHGTTYPNLEITRTTDAGQTWNVTDTQQVPIGRVIARTGSTIYSSSDAFGLASKSTDLGVTWTELEGSGTKAGWVAVTPTKLYVGDGYAENPMTIRHADLDSDEVWTDDAPQPSASGIGAAVAFDGTHYILVTAQGKGGVWRYIEP